MPRLTKSIVDKLQPTGHRFDVPCSEIAGFMVRVNADGSKTAAFRYRCDGRRRTVTIGKLGPSMTIDGARRRAIELRGEVQKGGDPARERECKRDAPTFADVAERYMSEIAVPKRKPSTARSYRNMLRLHLAPVLGPMKIASVERADVERLHLRIGKTSPGAANRVLALVSVIMTNAEAWGYRPLRSNPCHRLGKYPERKMERFLSAEERARLAEAFDQADAAAKGQPLYVCPGAITAIRLLSLTGARCGEIVGLQWSMVDLERALLRLPDSKTGAKVIPLSPPTVALLRRLAGHAQPGSAWVCAGEDGGQLHNIRRVWSALRKRAGLDDVRLHDLRHSAASDALAAGVPLAMIGAMLGHKSTQTTQRYAHLNDATLREAVRMMGEAIETSEREGADRLQQRRAVGADGGETSTGGGEVIPIGEGSNVIRMRPRSK